MCTSDADAAIERFIAEYSPELQSQIRACRATLQRKVGRGYELVYDNYNALVFGYGPTNKASAAVLSIAAYPKWIRLFFLKGAGLPDPESLLLGTGSQVRSIQLARPADLDSLAVSRLIENALAAISGQLAVADPLRTQIKSVSAKRRPRTPQGSGNQGAGRAALRDKRA